MANKVVKRGKTKTKTIKNSSNVVNTLENKDIKVLTVAAKSGMVSYDQLKDLGVDPKRRGNALINSGYLKKTQVEIETKDKNGKTKIDKKTYYTLADKGNSYVKQKGICTYVQAFHSFSHDVKVADEVIKRLNSGIDARNILNESEQEKFFKHEIHIAQQQGLDFRVSDLVIVDRNEETQEIKVELCEVYTENYTKEMKEQHQRYTQVFNNSKYSASYSYRD